MYLSARTYVLNRVSIVLLFIIILLIAAATRSTSATYGTSDGSIHISVEASRFIPHSYALIAQNILLELYKVQHKNSPNKHKHKHRHGIDNITVSVVDVEYPSPTW